MSQGPSLSAVTVRKKNRATTNLLVVWKQKLKSDSFNLPPCLPVMAAHKKLPGDQGGTDLGGTGAGNEKKADRAAVRKKKRGQKDSERSRGVLSPRLELGISRVSGGRINQLSHESAIRLRTLIGRAASGWL